MRIVFFGTPAFAADMLTALLAEGDIEVAAVVTQGDKPVGRKRIPTPPPVKRVALARGIPVWQPTSLKSSALLATLAQYGVDAFVVVAYGRILPQAVLDVPRFGVVNVHPSLLPAYRGPSPLNAAILAGDQDTGVCTMLLDADMDHGPLLGCERIALAPKETVETLTANVVAIGAPLLVASLRGLANGTIVPKPQDHAIATYCKLLTREDGVINWTLTADVIERRIRGLQPWPGTTTTWLRAGEPMTLKILAADVAEGTIPPGLAQAVDERLLVGTSTTTLAITKLQPAGGLPMDVAAFLRGYGDIHGAMLGSDAQTDARN